MAHLGSFIGSLQTQIRHVDGEILEAVRRQSTSGSRARQELRSSQASICEMLHQVSQIRSKAAETETMVQEICRDIKKLDFAKKHLTSTVTALRRLGMLITAVDQLQLAAERREFGDAAHLLGAVQQLAAHFKEYSHIPRIAEMRGRVAALEQSLRGASLREFELVGEDPPSAVLLNRLKECCAVTAAVGPGARDELVDSICRREMSIYSQIFSTTGETAKLERCMNRYKWLLRRLEARREVFTIVPVEWRLPQLLCLSFCSVTKTQLAEILDERAVEVPHQVANLLKAVEATHIFEAELARRYEVQPLGSTSSSSAAADGGNENGDRSDELDDEEATNNGAFSPENGNSSTAASDVKRKYERERAARERENSSLASPPPASRETRQQHAAAEAVARASFRGAISQVFVPYLRVYTDNVQRELLLNVDEMMKKETWQALATDQHILKSSNELTDAVRGEMRECLMRVSRGQTLLDLSQVFAHVYRAYAARLVARLPKSASGGTTGSAVLGVQDWQIKLADEDVPVVALILTTAEHSIEMVRQLERALQGKLEPPSLAEKVDFSEEEDAFRSVVTQCLSVLVLGTEARLELSLAALMRHNWGGVEIAGDQSEYVGAMRAVLADIGSRVGPSLPPNHFRFFCDRLLRSLAPRMKEAIFRCRVISVAGCQQLRLDVEALKGSLIGVAKAGQAMHDSPLWITVFTSDVNTQLAPVESVLKVVSSPPEALLDTFMELLPDAGASEFQKIADLKGLKRSELTAVLEEYSRTVGHVLPRSAVAKSAANAAGAVATPSRSNTTTSREHQYRLAGNSGSSNGGGEQQQQQQQQQLKSPLYDSFRGAGASRVASKASVSAQDMAARLRQNANLQALRATEGMRETTGRMLGAMKSLRFMQRDQPQQQQQ